MKVKNQIFKYWVISLSKECEIAALLFKCMVDFVNVVIVRGYRSKDDGVVAL